MASARSQWMFASFDIDLIDRINPFEAAYAVLSKAMDEKTLKQVAATIAAKRVNMPYEEARELALRAVKFKQERGRAPEITSQMPGRSGWLKASWPLPVTDRRSRMAELSLTTNSSPNWA